MVPTYHRLQDSPRLNQDITMVIRLNDQLRKGLDRDTSVDITKDYSQRTKLPFMKIVTPFKKKPRWSGRNLSTRQGIWCWYQYRSSRTDLNTIRLFLMAKQILERFSVRFCAKHEGHLDSLPALCRNSGGKKVGRLCSGASLGFRCHPILSLRHLHFWKQREPYAIWHLIKA